MVRLTRLTNPPQTKPTPSSQAVAKEETASEKATRLFATMVSNLGSFLLLWSGIGLASVLARKVAHRPVPHVAVTVCTHIGIMGLLALKTGDILFQILRCRQQNMGAHI